MAEIKLKKCVCGSQPHYFEKRECFGHGEFGTLGFVECSCGLRTKSFLVSGLYGCKDTKDTVLKFWNDLISKLLINKKETKK